MANARTGNGTMEAKQETDRSKRILQASLNVQNVKNHVYIHQFMNLIISSFAFS